MDSGLLFGFGLEMLVAGGILSFALHLLLGRRSAASLIGSAIIPPLGAILRDLFQLHREQPTSIPASELVTLLAMLFVIGALTALAGAFATSQLAIILRGLFVRD